MTFLDGKGVCLILIGKKIESHYFLWNLQIFFHGSPDFPLSGVGRSVSDPVADVKTFLQNLKIH